MKNIVFEKHTSENLYEELETQYDNKVYPIKINYSTSQHK